MKSSYAIAAVLAILIGSPAAAADFSGLRAELTAGRDKASVQADVENGSNPIRRSNDDVSFGAEAGYDLQFGSAVIGAYAGVDFSNVETCETLFGSDEFCANAKRNYNLGARAGFNVGGAALLYGKAGYTNGRFSTAYENFTNPRENLRDTDNVGGYHLGAGAEVAFGPVYGKAEYLRTEYKEGDLNFNVARDQIKLGIGVRF